MKMRKVIFKSIDHEGITAEMICIEQLQKRLMKALESADIDMALAAHKDIAKSLNQIQRYESQAKVHLLKQAASITKIKYPKSLKNRLRGLI